MDGVSGLRSVERIRPGDTTWERVEVVEETIERRRRRDVESDVDNEDDIIF